MKSRPPPLAPRRPRLALGALGALAALLALAPAPDARGAWPPPLRAERQAVAADHALASEAGLRALREGGNAIDGACAAAFALGVVNPQSSGIGGGGFLVGYLSGERRTVTLDFRETAPAAATRGMFREASSLRGGLAVAVPGEVAGCAEAVRRWGRLPLARVLKPAIELAGGFPAGEDLSARAAEAGLSGPGFAWLLPGGAPPRPGATLRNPALAGTLRAIAAQGPAGFYRGRVAREVVAAVRGAGGVMTEADLAGYRPVERAPVRGRYRGAEVVSMPPPSSGGVALIETLQIAERCDLGRMGAGSSAALHLVAEAFKHAFADRARHLGDPDFSPVPVGRLVSREYAASLRVTARAQPIDGYGSPAGAPAEPPRDAGTSHVSVVDAGGNAAALTTTVNTGFGSRVTAAGMVLNNEMDDFAARPGEPNAFGLVQSERNAVAPGKRPLSSMAPTIVLRDGAPAAVAGASGGPAIITGTAQALVGALDFGMDAQAAVSAPRIHHQWRPDELAIEPGIPRDVADALRARGHRVARKDKGSVVQLVLRRGGRWEAASDPRKGGRPAGE